MRWLGRARKAAQSQRRIRPSSVVRLNAQFAFVTSGGWPAGSSGNSVTQYCPGGKSTSSGRPRGAGPPGVIAISCRATLLALPSLPIVR